MYKTGNRLILVSESDLSDNLVFANTGYHSLTHSLADTHQFSSHNFMDSHWLDGG